MWLGALVVGAGAYGLLASTSDGAGWVDYLQSGGVLGMFIVLTWALLARRIVMGWTYDAMVAERDYYRGIAYRTTELADRQVGAAEQMLRHLDTLALRSEVMEAREQKDRRADP